MRKIPSEVHGVLDYLTGAVLLALPRLFGWRKGTLRLLTTAALGHMAYSLFTRYELGLVRILPFKTHLIMDAVAGVTLLAAPLLLKDEDAEVKTTVAALGAYELLVTAMTNPEPFEQDWANDLVDQARTEVENRVSSVREKVMAR